MSASVAQASMRIAPPPSGASLDHKDAKLGFRERHHLGKGLRAMYEALGQEPMSPKLQELVARLADKHGDA